MFLIVLAAHHAFFFFFFFNDTATTEIYTLSLHDALPIYWAIHCNHIPARHVSIPNDADRKSTRLNSSHLVISYAVFCLKKKKHITTRAGNSRRNTYTTASPTGTPPTCRRR